MLSSIPYSDDRRLRKDAVAVLASWAGSVPGVTYTITQALLEIAGEGGWLQQAGWTKDDAHSTYATGRIDFYFGLTTFFSYFGIDDQTLGTYVGAYPPYLVSGQHWVNITGMTQGQIYEALVGAANTLNPLWSAAEGPPAAGALYSIYMTALIPGPVPNYTDIWGNGHWAIGANSQGGGWEWRSAAAEGTGSQIGLLLYADAGSHLHLKTRFPSGDQWDYPIAWRARYTFLANCYSACFCILDPADDVHIGGDAIAYNNFFLCAVPCGTADITGLDEAALVIGASMHSLGWGGFDGREVAFQINASYVYGPSTNPPALITPVFPRLPDGQPLEGKGGGIILTPAYLAVGDVDDTTKMLLLGKLYDCAMLCAYHAPGDQMQIDGHRWLTLSQTSSIAGSLLWAFA